MGFFVEVVDLPKDMLQPVKQKNGQLDGTGLLAQIPNGFMHHIAANAWMAMHEAAFNEAKVVLAPSSKFDSYRKLAWQETGFRSHYTTEVIPGRPTKQWPQGTTWYLRPGQLEAATPGTSNHGFGLAIDVAGLASTPVNGISAWVLDNYERFGFSHEHRDGSDPQHIRYYRGDDIPKEVTGRGVRQRKIPPFDPENGVFSLFPLNPSKEAIVLGSEGDLVSYAQGVFSLKLGYATEINGIFDERMVDYVNWFKGSNGLEPNGVIGTRTWALIDQFAFSEPTLT